MEKKKEKISIEEKEMFRRVQNKLYTHCTEMTAIIQLEAGLCQINKERSLHPGSIFLLSTISSKIDELCDLIK